MPTSLMPGDVVADVEENSLFFEKQGLVVAVQLLFWGEPEITVRFDRFLYPYYLRDDESVDGIFEDYDGDKELRRDNDWDPEMYAQRLFRARWHTVSTLRDPLNRSELCMVEGCPNCQTQTAWFNCWGSVCNVYVCEEHFKAYNRMCGDSFPFREKSSA